MQVENDGEPMFGMLSQNFSDALNGPVVGTNEIVLNPAKAFSRDLQLLIRKGLVKDTGEQLETDACRLHAACRHGSDLHL